MIDNFKNTKGDFMFRFLASLILGLAVSGMANADEGSITYIFGDVGSLSSGDLCTGTATGLTLISCPNSTTAYRIGLGYTLPTGLGLELSYADLGSFDTSGTVLVNGTNYGFHLKMTQSAFMVPATYTLKFNENTALVFKLGLAFTQGTQNGTLDLNGNNFLNTSAGGSSGLYGIGITEKISDKFSARLQYELLSHILFETTSNTGINNLGFVSFGGQYQF